MFIDYLIMWVGFLLLAVYIFFFLVALRPNAGHGLLILEVSRSHSTMHHSWQCTITDLNTGGG